MATGYREFLAKSVEGTCPICGTHLAFDGMARIRGRWRSAWRCDCAVWWGGAVQVMGSLIPWRPDVEELASQWGMRQVFAEIPVE